MKKLGLVALAVVWAAPAMAQTQTPAQPQIQAQIQAQTLTLDNPTVAAIRARADAGDVEAMLDMAGLITMVHIRAATDAGGPNADVNGTYPEAQPWLERAAQTGDGEALYVLAGALNNGWYGLAADPERGQLMMEQAAKKGNGNAAFALDGATVSATPAPYPEPDGGIERLRWVEMVLNTNDEGDAATNADYDALAPSLGIHMSNWRLDYESSLIEAGNGDGFADLRVAQHLATGAGVAQDRVQAADWFARAAKAGDADTVVAVAQSYENGQMGEGREAEAHDYYRRAAALYRIQAEAGDVAAQKTLGELYAGGKTGTPDADSQAFLWYTKAAEGGDTDAQFNLAGLYYNGRGGPQDVAKALSWAERAADNNGKRLSADTGVTLGISQNQAKLGELYYDDAEVPRDYAKAAYWMSLAVAIVPDSLKEVSATRDAGLKPKIADCLAHLTPAQKKQLSAGLKAWRAARDPA